MESAPVPPEVLTRPLLVKFERVLMFCEVLTLKEPLVYVRPIPAVVVAEGTQVPALVYVRTLPAVPAAKSDEVAIAVGTAEPPVAFAQSEFAAIAAKLIEEFVPPICAPRVPEVVKPVPTAREEVATDW
jgi:predicted transcriptional regulator